MPRKLRILVVDDDAENADSLAELFGMDEHQVIVAYDGQQAIDAFAANDVDVGFFDVMMPRKNGVESFNEIRKAHPAARIYFMTGYSSDDLLAEAMKGGALGVFSKPMDLQALLNTIEAEAA